MLKNHGVWDVWTVNILTIVCYTYSLQCTDYVLEYAHSPCTMVYTRHAQRRGLAVAGYRCTH